MADRLLADEEVHELKLGQSFEPGGRAAYHSMYCKYAVAPGRAAYLLNVGYLFLCEPE